jgi:cytochrome c556
MVPKAATALDPKHGGLRSQQTGESSSRLRSLQACEHDSGEENDGMTRQTVLYAAVVLAALTVAALDTARADSPDLIALRQAVMSLQNGDFAYIRSVVKARGDVQPLEVPAKAIGKSSALIATLFPKGTETGGNTRALPEIWSDPSGFQKIATALGEAADKLAAAAKAGDADEVAASAKLVGEQCGACHKTYRTK